MALWPLKENRRAAPLEHPVADLGHLEARIDLGAHALQLAQPLELGEKIAQIAIGHAQTTVDAAPPSIGTIAPVT